MKITTNFFRPFLRKIVGDKYVDYIKRIGASFEYIIKNRSLTPKLIIEKQNIEKIKFDIYEHPKKHVFFGYYDRNPFNKDDTKLLACMCEINDSDKTEAHKLTLGYYITGNTNSFVEIAKTSTWSWQQGAMLQWLPTESDSIIYNDIINDKYVSKIISLSHKDTPITVPYPIYTLHPTKKLALSCNFSRLARLRPGYGYGNIQDNTSKELAPKNDGVWLVDLDRMNSRLIISLESLAAISPHASMEGASHYVHHFQFNPSGSRFMFIHLWVNNSKQFSRLFTCDENGSELFLLTDKYVSHYGWKNDDELLIFSYQEANGLSYYLYKDKTEIYNNVKLDGICEDGHCSYIGDEDTFISDTYPDKYGIQKLFRHSQKFGTTILAKFYSPVSFREVQRCDLHPRISSLSNKICIDTPHLNRRSIGVITYPKNITQTML